MGVCRLTCTTMFCYIQQHNFRELLSQSKAPTNEENMVCFLLPYFIEYPIQDHLN